MSGERSKEGAKYIYKHSDIYIAYNRAETVATGLIWGGQCRGSVPLGWEKGKVQG